MLVEERMNSMMLGECLLMQQVIGSVMDKKAAGELKRTVKRLNTTTRPASPVMVNDPEIID